MLITYPGGKGDLKNLKKGWKYGPGVGLLKRGEGLTLFLFHYFKVYHFHI